MLLDRITEVEIQGLRTVVNVRLSLSPLTVLTGENGSGKSTIIEACEILRRLPESNFLDEFLRIHGGLDALHSYGSKHVKLGLRIEGKSVPLSYSFQIEDVAGLAVTDERLQAWLPGHKEPENILIRSGPSGQVLDYMSKSWIPVRPVPGKALLLTAFGLRVPHPAISRVVQALQKIDVHLPFAVLPAWVLRSMGTNIPSMRVSPNDLPTESLTRLGLNLANVYKTLRESDESWKTTLEYVRIGLGQDIDDVVVERTSSGTGLEIWFKYRGFPKLVPARSLSDGTLDYLAFVALFRLSPTKTLQVFDEPENQLHPLMAARVAQFLESMARTSTVLVATHSDRFLDALSDPAKSVVLCSLDANRETVLVRPDPAALNMWLESYRGLGDLRSAGHESSVMISPEITKYDS